VEKSKIIISLFMLSIYLLVLLHNIIPHFHIDGDYVMTAEVVQKDHHHDHSDHHNHHHDDQPDHTSDSEKDQFPSLGYLLNGFYHFDAGADHLTHVVSENKITQPTLKVVCVFLVSRILPLTDAKEIKQTRYYFPPPHERLLSSSLPLRAPPALT